MNNVNLGNGVVVGIGAVVTRDVEAGRKVMGLDALDILGLVRLKRRLEFPVR